MFTTECAFKINHKRNNHIKKQSLLSWTAIVAPKICAYTLVSMMVVLIVGDVLQGRACGEYNGPRLFGVQAGRPG